MHDDRLFAVVVRETSDDCDGDGNDDADEVDVVAAGVDDRTLLICR